jgi:predicted RNA polymerase sigma factor
MGETEVRRTVETAWRMEAGRVVAGIAGIVRDGVPANPGAWLVTVSKRRAADAPPPTNPAAHARRTRPGLVVAGRA